MISFNNLGSYGRLGNQMFQYAALRGIAANRGFDFVFPPQYNSTDNYGLHDCFQLTNTNTRNQGFTANPFLQEGQFHFNQELFNNCHDNVDLIGYFQTSKYFQHIEDQIREDFTFKQDIVDRCATALMKFSVRPIMLHVRRGDPNLVDKRGLKWAYVNLQSYHPLQTLDYYENALSHFSSDIPVLVFSDSIEWCREQEFFKSSRFYFSEPTSKYNDGAFVPFDDLCLMTLCDGAIIANSTMSWWGAFLQNNRTRCIVSPSNWFGPALKDNNTSDLYCDGWIKI